MIIDVCFDEIGGRINADIDGGIKGDPGADGITPHIGTNGRWYIGDEDTGVKAEGTDGHTPEKGVDYWTETDKAEIVEEVLKEIPVGDEVSY